MSKVILVESGVWAAAKLVKEKTNIKDNSSLNVLLRRVSPFRFCGMGDSACGRAILTQSPQPSEGRLCGEVAFEIIRAVSFGVPAPFVPQREVWFDFAHHDKSFELLLDILLFGNFTI